MSYKKIKYLDPKNDLTFRKIFGEHPNILKSFLNSVLPLEPDRYIVELTYQDPGLLPQLPELKHSIVDVRCTDNQNRQFIVEMQMYWTDSFKNRMLFNAGKAYIKQIDRGHKYNELGQVFGLSLIDDIFLKGEENKNNYYHHYRLAHVDKPDEIIEGIELIFIELPKFKPQTVTEKKLQVLWLRFLTEINEDTEKIPEEFLSNTEIREALEHLQESAFTKDELAYYDKYWDKIRVERAAIEEVELRAEKAERAEEEAKRAEEEAKRAEEEAKKQTEQTKKEKEKIQIDTAKLLKNLNVDIHTIAEKTGLTIDAIKNL